MSIPIMRAVLDHMASKIAHLMNGGIIVEIRYSGLAERR